MLVRFLLWFSKKIEVFALKICRHKWHPITQNNKNIFGCLNCKLISHDHLNHMVNR